MRKKRFIAGVLILLAAMMTALAGTGSAEGPAFSSLNEAAKYVRENSPRELDVGTVRWRPSDLLKLKEGMSGEAALHFSTTWGSLILTDRDTEIDLNQVERITLEDVETVITLCPDVKKITMTKHYYLRNDPVIGLLSRYPEIEFIWMVAIKGRYRLPSNCEAYSSFNTPDEENKLKSEELEALQYVHGLKALDLGHNDITTLDWLKYCPDLELLILSDNKRIKDITPIGELKHLQYLEIFSTDTVDISPLANCTELIDLNLSAQKNVTDLSPLDGLTKLERFWGTRMYGLSEEEKERFTAVHEGVQISFNAKHQTSDGWREHERYPHYCWCLKHQEWIPFGEPLPGK